MRRSSGTRALGIAGALAILLTACSTTGAPSGGGQQTGPGATDIGKSFVIASTQFSPVPEQEALRQKILAGWKYDLIWCDTNLLQALTVGHDEVRHCHSGSEP